MQTNVLEYLDATAARFPDKPAVADERESLSFGELNRRSRAVGTALLRAVPGQNRPVAVLADRTAGAVAAMLGVLQSGNYYVPTDPKTPEARLQSIFETIAPAALIAGRTDKLPTLRFNGPRLTLEEEAVKEADDALLAAARRSVLDVDPVYVIFTSGSTGAPKGIVVNHRGIIDFTDWITKCCAITEDDRLANQAPLYFDTSVKNIYPALKTGATVHMLSKKLFSFPLLLMRYLNDQRLTTAIWSTSAFHLTAASGALEKEPPATLRLVVAGGEALQAKHLNRWRRALPDAVYFNHYGPTEVTVDCAYYRIDREFSDDEPVPIGRACENKALLLLTPEGKRAAPGEPGELCVRGGGLAVGYYGDWEKTSAAFTQNPLNPHYPDRIYHTGDLVVEGADGLLRFLSRKDNQIKHGGYRIELGEIETALNAAAGVDTAVCLFDRERDRIVAVYAGATDPNTLARAARAALPKYMVPSLYLQKDSLPYNANGKIDRVRLKEEYHASNP